MASFHSAQAYPKQAGGASKTSLIMQISCGYRRHGHFDLQFLCGSFLLLLFKKELCSGKQKRPARYSKARAIPEDFASLCSPASENICRLNFSSCSLNLDIKIVPLDEGRLLTTTFRITVHSRSMTVAQVLRFSVSR